MQVLLIGATGLVGGMAADRLLARGHEVHALLRRPTGRQASGWREHAGPMADWPALAAAIGPVDAAVSALGTTWHKAGSEQAFRAVDQDAVLAFARAAHRAGARRLVSVSSVGADPASANFYLRTKGETDAALAAIGFSRLDVLRPGLLLGERGGDRRRGERIAILLDPLTRRLLPGRLRRFAGMPAATVAAAIAAALDQPDTGSFVHENSGIERLAAA